MTAGELAACFDLSWPTMSGHFAVLKGAGLVHANRSGSTITYHLDIAVLQEALLTMLETFGIERASAPR